MNPVGKRALRIVLFGRPGAGKSSLLGALAIASERDESPWRLVEPTGTLAELRRHVEQHAPQPTITPEQVVPYSVVFHDREPAGPKTEVLLIDCDGNAALQLLSAERFPSEDDTPGPLAQEISRADAVILVVPAVESLSEAPPGEEDFTQLERFLRLLEEDRGSAVQAGGLPVMLALTKCDLLARPGDTTADWEARVAERRDELDGRFHKFRNERWKRGVAVFGQVTLEEGMATATQTPATPEEPAPFGVVPLFQQSIELARRYRRSQRQSTGRLFRVAVILMLLLAAIVLFGVYQRRLPSQADQQAIRTAIEQQSRWYEGLKDRGLELSRFSNYQPEEGGKVPWASWNREVEHLLDQSRSHMHGPEDRLPGAENATYQPVLAAEPVRDARAAWQHVADQITQRRNLVAAVGLVEPAADRPTILKIPPPPDFSVGDAKAICEQLATAYPQFRDWSLEGLPQGVAREIAAAAQTSVRHLALAGQKEILRQLDKVSSDGKESPALWRSLDEWLHAPAELQSWRELTVFLSRLYHPAAEDPIDVLKNFLDRTQHAVELQRLVLVVPATAKLTPTGKLSVYHGRKDEVHSTLNFKQLGEARREEGDPMVRYTFIPEAGELLTYRLGYRPGDTLWADLAVQSPEKQDRVLTWSLCRSQVFQFERLTRPPRLHGKDQLATDGELMQDIALTVAVGIVPRLPDLIPVVKLSRR